MWVQGLTVCSNVIVVAVVVKVKVKAVVVAALITSKTLYIVTLKNDHVLAETSGFSEGNY